MSLFPYKSTNENDRRSGDRLRHFILAQLRESGPVPFSRFMEWCLYHPDYGYYNSEGTKIGKGGDYFTAPSVHPIFGRLVAKQLVQMDEILERESFTVVEIGAGRGYLCLDVLDWLRENVPAFYRRLTYRLFDSSRCFLREQKEKLALYEQEGKISWGEEQDLEKSEGMIEGCFLSNELVDAFPVHRVVLKDGKLWELYVEEQNGFLGERIGDLSSPEIGEYFNTYGVTLEEGQQAEVNLRAREWIKKVGRCLRRGFVVTIDYGYRAGELYDPWRRAGTIMCYFRHRALENPYERIGGQDITSHVNFSALIRDGEKAGLQFTGLVPQYRFLIALGLLREMEEAARGMSDIEGLQMRLALKHLIEPDSGMGERFKVLIQHKGIENPQLDGLRDFDSMPRPC